MSMRKVNSERNIIKSKKIAYGTVLTFLKYFFLISIGYIIIFQIAYMISYAFRSSVDINDPSIVWIPRNLTLENFKNAIEIMDYVGSFWNTISIQVLSGIIEIVSCAVVAYGFARFKFAGKNLLFALVVITIVVPNQMIAVPLYLNYADFDILGIFGLFNNLTGIDLRPNLLDSGAVFYLPSLFASGIRSGLFIFIYRQFFVGMPLELEEAAAIDGAGPIRTFTSIIVPSSGVAIITVAIFSLVWHWNEYYLSALFFDEKYPLSVRLSNLSESLSGGGVSDDRNLRMAACLIFALPVLIVYILLQRKFIQSIDRVGIVG